MENLFLQACYIWWTGICIIHRPQSKSLQGTARTTAIVAWCLIVQRPLNSSFRILYYAIEGCLRGRASNAFPEALRSVTTLLLREYRFYNLALSFAWFLLPFALSPGPACYDDHGGINSVSPPPPATVTRSVRPPWTARMMMARRIRFLANRVSFSGFRWRWLDGWLVGVKGGELYLD